MSCTITDDSDTVPPARAVGLKEPPAQRANADTITIEKHPRTTPTVLEYGDIAYMWEHVYNVRTMWYDMATRDENMYCPSRSCLIQQNLDVWRLAEDYVDPFHLLRPESDPDWTMTDARFQTLP